MEIAVKKEREKRNYELKKHVNAIHCSNNLSLVQRKLFNALLFNAYPDLPYKQQFEVRGKQLSELIGYNSKDVAKLKSALLGLITTAIEWNVIDCNTGQEKKWRASSILASAELSQGRCLYEYSQVMKELLYQPEMYGRLNIELVAKFKSSYGLALYENCIRYQGLPQTPWFSIEIFRKLMGVFDGKYAAFKDFKKRVIDIAVAEINAISPVLVTPEVERVNQKVTQIRFKLKNRVGEQAASVLSGTVNAELKDILSKTFGLSDAIIAEVISQYEEAYIREKLEVIIQSPAFLSGKIRGLAGYFINALKKDYQPSKSSKAVVDSLKKAQEVEAQEKQKKEESRAERYNKYISNRVEAYLASLDAKQHEALIDQFEIHMRDQSNVFQRWYRQSGFEHAAVKACFKQFIKDSNKLGALVSQEEFMSLIDESN